MAFSHPPRASIDHRQSLLFLGAQMPVDFVDSGNMRRPIAGPIADSGFKVSKAFRGQGAKQDAMRIYPFVKGAGKACLRIQLWGRDASACRRQESAAGVD